MANIELHREKILDGKVLNKQGKWCCISEAIAEEKEFLKHQKMGKLLVDGVWVKDDIKNNTNKNTPKKIKQDTKPSSPVTTKDASKENRELVKPQEKVQSPKLETSTALEKSIHSFHARNNVSDKNVVNDEVEGLEGSKTKSITFEKNVTEDVSENKESLDTIVKREKKRLALLQSFEKKSQENITTNTNDLSIKKPQSPEKQIDFTENDSDDEWGKARSNKAIFIIGSIIAAIVAGIYIAIRFVV